MDIKVEIQGIIENNCYLISDGQNAYIIDPSTDNNIFINQVKELGLKLRGIYLTHFHLDHITGVLPFSSLPIYITKVDYDILMDKRTIPYMVDNFFMLGYISDEKCKKMNEFFATCEIHFVEENFILPEFKYSLVSMFTPGHSPGSLCLYCKEEKVLFSGDTLFYHSHGRTDLPFSDGTDMSKSLRKLSELPKDTRVYPGHGQTTTIGEEKSNGYLRFV